MRWLVVGGTGRTGRRVVEAGLAAGHEVRALGRSASAATVPHGAEPVPASAIDEAELEAALDGVDAVIVALSIPRAGPSPFARVTGEPRLHSESARVLIGAMERTGVRRLVKVSVHAAGDSAARAGLGFRLLAAVSNLGPAFADHGVADALVEASGLDWTIVRPPVLSDASGTAPLVVGPDVQTTTFDTVRRSDLARWIAEAVDDPRWHGRTVSVREA